MDGPVRGAKEGEWSQGLQVLARRAQYCRRRLGVDPMKSSSDSLRSALALVLSRARAGPCRGEAARARAMELSVILSRYQLRVEAMNRAMRSLASDYSQLEGDYSSLREYLTNEKRDFSFDYTPIPTRFPGGDGSLSEASLRSPPVPSSTAESSVLVNDSLEVAEAFFLPSPKSPPLESSAVALETSLLSQSPLNSQESSSAALDALQRPSSPLHSSPLPAVSSSLAEAHAALSPPMHPSRSPAPPSEWSEASLPASEGAGEGLPDGDRSLFLSGPSDFAFTDSLPPEEATRRLTRVIPFDYRSVRTVHLVELNDASIVQPDSDSEAEMETGGH